MKKFFLLALTLGLFVNFIHPKEESTIPPIIIAAQNGNIDEVKKLIEAGADINAESHVGTALNAAIDKGFIEIVKILIAAGADINHSSHGWTPLNTVVEQGNIEIVKMLLDAGAQDQISENNMSALMWAVMRNHYDIAKLLIKSGADVNASWHARGRILTPLTYALDKNDTLFAKLLLDAGANQSLLTPNERIALTLSLKYNISPKGLAGTISLGIFLILKFLSIFLLLLIFMQSLSFRTILYSILLAIIATLLFIPLLFIVLMSTFSVKVFDLDIIIKLILILGVLASCCDLLTLAIGRPILKKRIWPWIFLGNIIVMSMQYILLR